MSLKITKKFQVKLENILESQEYKIRFEKGNFKSGYCIIKDKKVVIINKYFSLEGKINAEPFFGKYISPATINSPPS